MHDLEKALLEYNKKGFFARCSETKELFFQRVSNKTSYSESIFINIFDISVDWVPIIYEKKGLHWWEGGCTWIREDGVQIQLNPALKGKEGSYLGYRAEEIIAHEIVHASRLHFNEVKFEEILAYQTATSFFRRYFGPLFRSALEVRCFLYSILFFFFLSFFLFSWISTGGVVFIISFFLLRLVYFQHIFKKAVKCLSLVIGKSKAFPVLLRLKDDEIIVFSRLKKEEVDSFIVNKCKASLRWQQIHSAYFFTRPN